MTPSPTRLLLALACCLAASPAMAAKVNKVELKGLADPAMQDNVRGALSLSDELDKDISARRLNYLLRQAEAETREALEPFGYYSPTIVIRRSDRDRPGGRRQRQRQPRRRQRCSGQRHDRCRCAGRQPPRTQHRPRLPSTTTTGDRDRTRRARRSSPSATTRPRSTCSQSDACRMRLVVTPRHRPRAPVRVRKHARTCVDQQRGQRRPLP
jgi:hypothetical protein